MWWRHPTTRWQHRCNLFGRTEWASRELSGDFMEVVIVMIDDKTSHIFWIFLAHFHGQMVVWFQILLLSQSVLHTIQCCCFFFFMNVLSYWDFSYGKFRLLPPQGKPAATELCYSTCSASLVFLCFHTQPNFDMDYTIVNMCTLVINACGYTWRYTDTIRVCIESCLWKKFPLPHQRIKSASATCRSDAVPAEVLTLTVPHPPCIMYQYYLPRHFSVNSKSELLFFCRRFQGATIKFYIPTEPAWSALTRTPRSGHWRPRWRRLGPGWSLSLLTTTSMLLAAASDPQISTLTLWKGTLREAVTSHVFILPAAPVMRMSCVTNSVDWSCDIHGSCDFHVCVCACMWTLVWFTSGSIC